MNQFFKTVFFQKIFLASTVFFVNTSDLALIKSVSFKSRKLKLHLLYLKLLLCTVAIGFPIRLIEHKCSS